MLLRSFPLAIVIFISSSFAGFAQTIWSPEMQVKTCAIGTRRGYRRTAAALFIR